MVPSSVRMPTGCVLVRVWKTVPTTLLQRITTQGMLLKESLFHCTYKNAWILMRAGREIEQVFRGNKSQNSSRRARSDFTAAVAESSSPDNRYIGQLKKCDMCVLEKRTGSQPDVVTNKKLTQFCTIVHRCSVCSTCHCSLRSTPHSTLFHCWIFTSAFHISCPSVADPWLAPKWQEVTHSLLRAPECWEPNHRLLSPKMAVTDPQTAESP